ncbi:MAG: HEAT repeat domain-containing protein [Polyangiaceae bacterium]
MLDEAQRLTDEGRGHLRAGRTERAVSVLLDAAALTHVPEAEYRLVLGPLAEAFEAAGRFREAASVAWYLAAKDPRELARKKNLLGKLPPTDHARSLTMLGEGARAAAVLEEAGRIAAAAIVRENAEDWAGARMLWARLVESGATRGDSYVGALVAFNLARTAKKLGDVRPSHDAFVRSVSLLEEGADHFETIGQRERAFDCFQVLVQIGRESGMFEDVLEGYVNCIRILREDHLKYFALQHYDEAIAAAETAGETAAAATLAREASAFARSIGLEPASRSYTLRAAELWLALARSHVGRGAPPEIAENAYLASILAFGEAGRYRRVGDLYEEISRIGLDEARSRHYLRATKRYEGVADERLDASPLPSHTRRADEFPDVWHVDVLEWEQAGSAAEATADVVVDTRWPELIRRKALLARFVAIAYEPVPDDVGLGVKLAAALSDLQLFAALSPLERLYESKSVAVRAAVAKGAQLLFFKRTLTTVRRALRDPSPEVVRAATASLSSLYFQHAFDPLARIVREFDDDAIRAGAIAAIARIDTQEAAEFLLAVLEHGSENERGAAENALRESRGMRFVEHAKAHLATTNDATRARLQSIFEARGLRFDSEA